MKTIFFHSKYKYLLCFIFSLIVIGCYLLLYGISYMTLADSFFSASAIMLCVGGLSFCNNMGAFDIFSYTFANKGTPSNRITLYDYQEKKKEKRKNIRFTFIPYIVVGIFFLIISFILFSIYTTNLPQ